MYSKNSSGPSVALRHTTCYIQARLCITNFDILLNKINRPLPSSQNPHFQNEATIGDKVVETLNRVISENKRIRTPPLSPPLKVGVFFVFYRQLEQGHNIARRGWGRKAIFPPFEVNKT